MARDKRGPRKVGLTSPQVLVPAIIALVIVGFLLLIGSTSAARTVPGETRAYEKFEEDVRAGQVVKIQMYRDVVYATYPEDRLVLVQDVSPEYTLGLVKKYNVAYDGLPQGNGGPVGMGVLAVVLLPYLFLGWLTVMMVRAAGSAADVDSEGLAEEPSARCPECSRPTSRDARFCPHCAHPVQWTGQVRQCQGCGHQVWKGDRHCRSCGRGLPTPEARRSREAAGVEAQGAAAARESSPGTDASPAARRESPAGREAYPASRRESAPGRDASPGPRPSSAQAGPAPSRESRSRPPTPGPLPGERS